MVHLHVQPRERTQRQRQNGHLRNHSKQGRAVVDFHERINNAGTIRPFNNVCDLQMVAMYRSSLSFLFHGIKEHWNLKWVYVSFGVVTENELKRSGLVAEEYKSLVGCDTMTVAYSGTHKRQKLSAKNPTFDKKAKSHHFVSDPNDKYDVVKVFKWMLKICHPDQTWVYCHAATERQKASYDEVDGRSYCFNHHVRLGKQEIGLSLRRLAKAAGVEEFDRLSNHLARGEGLTTLVNDRA